MIHSLVNCMTSPKTLQVVIPYCLIDKLLVIFGVKFYYSFLLPPTMHVLILYLGYIVFSLVAKITLSSIYDLIPLLS